MAEKELVVRNKELDYGEKIKDFGHRSAALIYLHRHHPEKYNREELLNKLLEEYEHVGLQAEEEVE